MRVPHQDKLEAGKAAEERQPDPSSSVEADKGPHEPHVPIDDQDSFDDFVTSLYARIQHKLAADLDVEVQTELGYLIQLLSTMQRFCIERHRVFFEIAFDLLATEKPNIALIRTIRHDLSIAHERSASRVTRIMLIMCGKTPITTVLAGVISAFMLLAFGILAMDQLHAEIQQLRSDVGTFHPVAEIFVKLPMDQIMVLMCGAFFGAVVSVLGRFRLFLDMARFSPLAVYVTVATKPFISIVFALFIFAVLKAGIVSFLGVDLSGLHGTAIAWVLGFLSGFSERFVHDFVVQTGGKLGEPNILNRGNGKGRKGSLL